MVGREDQKLWEWLQQRREGIGQVATKGAEIDLRNQGGGKMSQDCMTMTAEQKFGLFLIKGLCLTSDNTT